MLCIRAYSRNIPIRGKGILTSLQFAGGEADVQPSLLPGYFSTRGLPCQGIFSEICGESPRTMRDEPSASSLHLWVQLGSLQSAPSEFICQLRLWYQPLAPRIYEGWCSAQRIQNIHDCRWQSYLDFGAPKGRGE